MVRVISVSSLGFEYGSYNNFDGLDFSTVLEDNPSDDLILRSLVSKQQRKGTKRSSPGVKRSTPQPQPIVALNIGQRIS
jgi:hypothetical protein